MTNSGTVQVLVVDDVLDAAESFAALIRDTTGLVCCATNSPGDAVAIVESNVVLVAVLDQRMPEKEGTELFQELRLVAPAIEAIMLTGEASISEIGKAVSLGFNQILAKKDVDKLPEMVRNLYHTTLARVASQPVIKPVELVAKRRKFGLVRSPSLRLVGFTVLEENYVNNKEWETYLHLTVGEKRTDEVQFKVTHSFTLEKNSKISIQSTVGVKGLKLFEAKLDSDLTTEIGITEKRDTSLSSKTDVTYELPGRPADNSAYIQAVNYQYAPTYRRVRLELERHCDACDGNERSVVIALFATGRFLTRHEEISNTGDSEVKPTGLIRGDNLKRVGGQA
jgi:CheY-like chemotaxis protein